MVLRESSDEKYNREICSNGINCDKGALIDITLSIYILSNKYNSF